MAGRTWTVAGALGAVLALTGCSGPAGDGDRAAPTPAPSAAVGLGDRTGDANGAPAATPTEKVTKEITASYDFWTPSKNIGCYVGPDIARCDIVNKSWRPPPSDDCELSYGGGVAVSGAEKAALTCAGDTVLGSGETLQYGEVAKVGDFMCDSERSGVRCENSVTGHGFTLAREKYTLF